MTLVRLAVRELWISFRLLAVFGSLLLCGMAAALLPAISGWSPQAAYAIGLAAASIVGAAVAALALAGARGEGSFAWLAVRAVPRSEVLFAWLLALWLVVAAGLVVSTAVAWLIIAEQPAGAGSAFLLGTLAAAAAMLLALSVGVLAGAILPAPLAVSLAALVSASLAIAGLMAWPLPLLPSAGFGLLLRLAEQPDSLRVALQATGFALVLSGMLIAAGNAVLGRADL